MPEQLAETEARVLACLYEKQVTTPEYYPLTLNSLTLACNQKSNRDPVTAYDDKAVGVALDGLRAKKLAWQVHPPGSRTPKFEHRFDEFYALNQAEAAILCELILRGPQTLGELRGHASRLCAFASIQEVEVVVRALAERPEPLLVELPRQPGRKEPRFRQLLGAEPGLQRPAGISMFVETPPDNAAATPAEETVSTPPCPAPAAGLAAEIAALRQEVADLRRELQAVKDKLADLLG